MCKRKWFLKARIFCRECHDEFHYNQRLKGTFVLLHRKKKYFQKLLREIDFAFQF